MRNRQPTLSMLPRLLATTAVWARRLLACAAALLPVAAHADCSAYAGATSGPITSKISINEYNYSGNYFELKIIDSTLLTATSDLDGWILSWYKASGGGGNTRTDYVVKNYITASGGCGAGSAYIKIPTGSNIGNDSVLVLWSDSSRTKEVDYFRLGQNSYPAFQATTCFLSEVPSASTSTYHQGALAGSSSRKDIARGPDGSGTWFETPYTGGDQGTPCGSNDGTLAITKTVTANATQWIGNSSTFRITVALDPRAANQTTVVVNDLLPSPFSYVSHVASTGTYNSGTGVWTIGNLAAGASVTLDITANLAAAGTLTNSATVTSDFFGTGKIGAATATVDSILPTITNTASPTTVTIGSNTTFTVTVTNPSATLTSPAFTVTNTLSAGLTLVSYTPGSGSMAGNVWSPGTLAPGASATLTVLATVTQSGSLTDTAQVTLNGYSPTSASATATVTGAAPSAFNAWTTLSNKTIQTRIAGSAFPLTVGSFDGSSNPAAYTGTVTTSLEYCTDITRTALGGISCGGNWTAIGSSSATATFSNVTTATASVPAISNAYEIVRVKLMPATGSAVYATDYFAIRPSALTVAATDLDWTTAGTTNALSGTNKHKAGQPFTLTLGTTGASNYPGTTMLPFAALAPVATVTPPAGSVAGTLSGGTWSATTGGMVSSTAAYSEVGSLTLTMTDQHYADIDTGDSTTTERYVTGSAAVGRFVPNHLTTAVTPGCSTFTYSGQPMQVEVKAFAFGGASPAQNYDATATFSQSVTLSNAGDATSFTNNTTAASVFAAGIGTDTDVTYTFASKATAPATLTLRAVDADNVSSAGSTEGTATIRSGRLRLQNANGSELLPLPLAVAVQYYQSDATAWQTSTGDTCSILAAANFAFNFPVSSSNQLSACETAVTVSGSPPSQSIILSRPGSGNNGWTDITVNLGATSSGNQCSTAGAAGPAAVPAAKAWLQYDWQGAGAADPKARATFGVYRSGPVLHRREVY